MSRSQTEIYSVYGEIEAMVAMDMGFRRIPFWNIPETARFNKYGQPARFAVIVPRSMIDEFEQRIALMRA